MYQLVADKYREYIESLAENPQNLIKLAMLFNKQRQQRSQARINSRNPNRAPRGPVEDDEDEAAEQAKRDLAARFHKAFNKFHIRLRLKPTRRKPRLRPNPISRRRLQENQHQNHS